MEDVAILFAFDQVQYSIRCETTIYAVRREGNYSGPIEVVAPRGFAFSRDYNLRMRTLEQVVGTSEVPLEPPRPCDLLNEKRRQGWRGYYTKTLASMSSYWAMRYRRIIFMDCGMQVHRSLAPLVSFDPGHRLVAHSACYPEYKWGMEHVIHPECGKAAARELAFAYPKALKADFFQSTLMIYPTDLLGRSHEALRDIVGLYQRFGAVVEGDQELLSLYWIHKRSAAGTLPLVAPHCLYDYLPRKPHPHNCRTFVVLHRELHKQAKQHWVEMHTEVQHDYGA
ncbi:hypothetical protein AB1Y20_009543 [Prymnesium parvum]|uniref:Hexosyltransferase n=1 Tax=Prymnesium parvum TaxID=97485 RepID=A0AB34K0Z4_PRYPA